VYLVGIIPGPNKPSLEQINHFLKPLVDELLILWDTGVFFSRTAKYQEGRLVRCALVPLVCDLPAARQTAGFGGFKAKYFCSMCLTTLADQDSIDVASWVPRSCEAHKAAARAWRDKTTTAQRDAAFRSNSTRWSELLNLPYWDPIKYTVIDSMHNHYLGLLKHHCRNIWGMNVSADDTEPGDGTAQGPKVPPTPPEADLLAGLAHLYSGTPAQLASCTNAVLRYLCYMVGVTVGSKVTKNHLVNALQNWVSERSTSNRRPTARAVAKEEDIVKARKALDSGIDPQKLSKNHNLAVLRAVCELEGVDDHGHKVDIARRLYAKVRTIIAIMTIQVHLPPSKVQNAQRVREQAVTDAQPESVVFGRNMMARIHEEIPRTEVPSWINPVPNNVGTKTRGKLSADQWHIFCVVNLPVILIGHWAPQGGRFLDMLNNYMHLVTEVVVGSLLEMSEEAIALYETSALEYLKTAKELYDISVTPNQHNSLHIPFLLRLFGPLHSIRAFFTERMNYLLQQQNTNLKFGDLEITYMKHSCRAANLRAILDDPTIRPDVEELVDAYEQFRTEDRRGTRLRESVSMGSHASGPRRAKVDGKPIHLSDTCFAALVKHLNSKAGSETFIDMRERRRVSGSRQLLNRAIRLPSLQIHGVSFRAENDSSKDSNVIYWKDETRKSTAAARIQEIFSYSYREPDGNIVEGIYLFVLPYTELNHADVAHDYYRRYPLVGGCLYYDRKDPGVIITPDIVVSHFARTPVVVPAINEPCIHSLPLDKVRTTHSGYI
ncbi:hypothetical protein FKP32DRAFT_1535489, partial [Trametes sanguinea]